MDVVTLAMAKKMFEPPIIRINGDRCFSSFTSWIPLEEVLVGMTLEEAVSMMERALKNKIGVRLEVTLTGMGTATFQTSLVAENNLFAGLFTIQYNAKIPIFSVLLSKKLTSGQGPSIAVSMYDTNV